MNKRKILFWKVCEIFFKDNFITCFYLLIGSINHIKLKILRIYFKVDYCIITIHQVLKWIHISMQQNLNCWMALILNKLILTTNFPSKKVHGLINKSCLLNWQNSSDVLLRLGGMTGRQMFHRNALPFSNSKCLFSSFAVLLFLNRAHEWLW